MSLVAVSLQVRTSVPSVQSLRSWKKALGGLSQEAFSAIRDVFQSEEKSVDARALSLNILTTQAFMNLNSASACTQQSFVVHIIVRYVYECCNHRFRNMLDFLLRYLKILSGVKCQ